MCVSEASWHSLLCLWLHMMFAVGLGIYVKWGWAQVLAVHREGAWYVDSLRSADTWERLVGVNVVRPVSALICGEDCPHFCVWG